MTIFFLIEKKPYLLYDIKCRAGHFNSWKTQSVPVFHMQHFADGCNELSCVLALPLLPSTFILLVFNLILANQTFHEEQR